MTRDTATRVLRGGRASGPKTSSVAFCHDAFVNEEVEYYELLGFCGEGEGDTLVADGRDRSRVAASRSTPTAVSPHGVTPVARPGSPSSTNACSSSAATPTGRQVEDARVALAHLVGGGSVCTVNLLGVTD